jgi:ABC-type sugar transport system ATPase subunit
VNTRVEIARLHRQLKATMIYVTHDQVEAMTLADRIVVMNEGRIEQEGKPLDLYYKPNTLFVARFIGSPAMNLLPAAVSSASTLTLKNGPTLSMSLPRSVSIGGDVTFGIRPEHMQIDDKGDFNATLELVERTGESGFAHLRLSNGQAIIVETRGQVPATPGAQLGIKIDARKSHYFGPDGQRLI